MRSNIQNLPPSGIRLLLAIAEDADAVSIGFGEPAFDTPDHIIQAAHDALSTGKTHYSPDHGILELRQAISEEVGAASGIKSDPTDEVIVTAGTSPAFFNAMMALVDSSEEILIPEPSYFSYRSIARIIGATPVAVPTFEHDGFVPTAEAMAECITPKSKLLVVCSPNNPTGAVWGEDTLRSAADLAQDHDLVVLSDEVYRKITFGGNCAHSIAGINGMRDRTLVFNGLSKSHAMAGFRLGWVVGPRDLLAGFKRIHENNSICAPVISQYAALAALTGPQDPIREMLAEYERQRGLLVNRLNNEVPLVSVRPPQGSFFMFANVTELTESHHRDIIRYMQSREGRGHLDRLPKGLLSPQDLEQSGSLTVMLYLYAKARVVTASGALFGESGEGYLRLSFAQNSEVINDAIDRMIRALKPWE